MDVGLEFEDTTYSPGLVSINHIARPGISPHTDNSSIIPKQETRRADEESKEVCPEGAKPCSLQPHVVRRTAEYEDTQEREDEKGEKKDL